MFFRERREAEPVDDADKEGSGEFRATWAESEGGGENYRCGYETKSVGGGIVEAIEARSIRAGKIVGENLWESQENDVGVKGRCRSEDHTSDEEHNASHGLKSAAMARIKRGRRCRRLVQI